MSSFSITACMRPRNSSESTCCRRWTCCRPSPCCFTSPLTRAIPESMATSLSENNCSALLAVVASASDCAAAPTCWKAASRLVTRLATSSSRAGARSCSLVRMLSTSPFSRATMPWTSARRSSSTFINANRPETSPWRLLSALGISCDSAACSKSFPGPAGCAGSPAPSLHQASNIALTALRASAQASATAWQVMLRSNSSPSARLRTRARSKPFSCSSSSRAFHCDCAPSKRSAT
mmetsp:Transcript_83331/g.258784  ORF Transcript_83331/g.258784 Transcript_83331/m.258784 type:complete len:236 (-) Transcript_83331:644-1351(-)